MNNHLFFLFLCCGALGVLTYWGGYLLAGNKAGRFLVIAALAGFLFPLAMGDGLMIAWLGIIHAVMGHALAFVAVRRFTRVTGW